MFDYLFTFRALTPAQSARNVLSSAGIPALLERAPRTLSTQGCGYVLRVGANGAMQALSVFRSRNVGYARLYRAFYNGTVEEVRT